MKIKQISIFLENKIGRLAEVTKLLADSKINIRTLSLAETAEFGVLRLIVSDPDACLKVLKDNQFVAQETDVIAVEVQDKPGGLNRILEIFHKNDINIEYMYAFVEKKVDNAIVVFRIDNAGKAIAVLQDHNIAIVSDDIIKNL
ncbi:MAG: ACT domain-containing protein [Spirochaetales bacterium]|nr:ACT domain-containing protein [Spirochaetales bacterium]